MMTPDEAQPAGGQPRPTPLRAVHERLGATMTGFAGWLMPLRYGSEIAEHRAVRSAAGLFDLSHMGEIAVTGPGADAALDYALTGHMSALKPGRARYTMICAPDGGVLDDLIVYRLADTEFLVVANAANTAAVAGALRERAASYPAQVDDKTSDYALIAIQGPHAGRILQSLTDTGLDQVRYYAGQPAVVAGREVLLARTGYTGEDGFELYAPNAQAVDLWRSLLTATIAADGSPAGLACRDTLRLEAGMALYGHELSRHTNPYQAGLGKVVRLARESGRDFVGRDALQQLSEQAVERTLVALKGSTRRAARAGYTVHQGADGTAVGTITSGALSPTLGYPIALAYLDAALAEPGTVVEVDIRGKKEQFEVTSAPFYRRN